jgi:uracil-DNA glycosylase
VEKKKLQKKVSDYLGFIAQQPKGFVYRDDSATQSSDTTKLHNNKQQIELLFCGHVNCNACPLATQGRTQVVFGHGNTNARIMFIGEGPGRDEDEQGFPFIGRAGQLLTKIIEAMKLTRESVYISNVVKCRPPNNRVPLPTESNTCKKILLFKEIDIIKPHIICTLGSTAAQAILGDDLKITKARGIFHTYKGIPVMPTYHPAYLLRNPDAKKIVWLDMKNVMEKLNE